MEILNRLLGQVEVNFIEDEFKAVLVVLCCHIVDINSRGCHPSLEFYGNVACLQ